jgi:type I restriction enzyme S subunit
MSEKNGNNKQLPFRKLGEIAKFIDYRGKTPKKTNSGIPLITAKNVKMGYINEEPREFIAEEDYDKWMTRGFPKLGDILFTTEAPLGNVAQLKTNGRIALAQRMITFQPFEHVQNTYLKYALMSPQFQELLNKKGTGTTVKGIKAAILKQLEIPVPSIEKQKQIVSKIEELFSELDKSIEQLKTAQQQLKVYRQSVLKWAFEDLIKENTIEEITASSLIGLVRSSREQNENRIGVPYVKMNNVDLNGNVDFSELVYVDASTTEIEKFHLKNGDVLINTRNSFELVGKTGIVREEKTNAVFNNNLLRIRVKNNFLPLFIGYQLINPSLKAQMLREKKATTNVCALYQRDIFPLRVKVCDIEEQSKIVQEIERRLSVADKLEETIANSLQQAEALRQSILKEAFEGELL